MNIRVSIVLTSMLVLAMSACSGARTTTTIRQALDEEEARLPGADAESRLGIDSGERMIRDGQAMLEEGRRQVRTGQAMIAEGNEMIRSVHNSLNSGAENDRAARQLLDDGIRSVRQGNAMVSSGNKMLAKGEETIRRGRIRLEESLQALRQSKS